ncbi:MAG: hypothetical protein JRJ75_07915 [Deltaproteobacteria bacterium]|nr:hypothetical protein [Deltaproteobacteria bacterium]MBW1929027.1 hypothetical protein [Deltaproteobacteria bacterium]MBW2027285.1 hypothetical protein [Deltaproteobacteria bacterium]
MEYNPFTLRFVGEDEQLETRFLKYYFRNCLTITRVSLLVGLVFYAAFGILDAVLLPEVKQITWFIRYAIVCPLILFFFLMSFHPNYKKWWQVSFVLIISSAGLGIIYMIVIAPQPVNFSYYAGLILVFIFGYTFFRTRFIWASITCWGIVVLYEIVACCIIKAPFSVFVNNNFFFVGANIAGMFACYSIEFSARRNFYLQELLKKEKVTVAEVNQELESKIAELEKASSEIKTLSGLLPICAKCKKIRDDKGYWSQIEIYIKEHSEAQFTHGLCPECAKELYGDLVDPSDDK